MTILTAAPNEYTLRRERRGLAARFAFDVLAPLLGFSVVLAETSRASLCPCHQAGEPDVSRCPLSIAFRSAPIEAPRKSSVSSSSAALRRPAANGSE